jgi:hypothetical protein
MKDSTIFQKLERCIPIDQKEHLRDVGMNTGFISLIVKLYKVGKASNHNVFELWKEAFPRVNETEFNVTRKLYISEIELLRSS